MILQSHSWPHVWKKPYLKKIHTHQCSLQHYLQQPRRGSNTLSDHRQRNGQGRCNTGLPWWLGVKTLAGNAGEVASIPDQENLTCHRAVKPVCHNC